VDLKITAIVPIPWKFSCPLCGGTCTTKVPIVGKTIQIKMPDCPIAATGVKTTKSIALPADNPLPIKNVKVAGTITFNNASKPFASVKLDADLKIVGPMASLYTESFGGLDFRPFMKALQRAVIIAKKRGIRKN
jgi:hypothetical protein